MNARRAIYAAITASDLDLGEKLLLRTAMMTRPRLRARIEAEVIEQLASAGLLSAGASSTEGDKATFAQVDWEKVVAIIMDILPILLQLLVLI